MFDVKLRTNRSEPNAFNKTLVDIATLSGTLRENTSLIDPVITIEASAENIASCNYITIPAFRRSYFVTGIRSIIGGLWEISAHVDVLVSFKDEILANRAIVARNEEKWNLYLDDGEFRVYNNPIVTTKLFPQTEFDTTNPTYVLAMAGGN